MIADSFRFHIHFQHEPASTVPNLALYRGRLLEFDPADWYVESGSGALFRATIEGGIVSTLVLSPEAGRGISLARELCQSIPQPASKRVKRIFSLVSVGNAATINEFLLDGDEWIHPVGSYVTPEQAWWAIEDFFAAPMQASPRLEWIETDSLDYPDPHEFMLANRRLPGR